MPEVADAPLLWDQVLLCDGGRVQHQQLGRGRAGGGAAVRGADQAGQGVGSWMQCKWVLPF